LHWRRRATSANSIQSKIVPIAGCDSAISFGDYWPWESLFTISTLDCASIKERLLVLRAKARTGESEDVVFYEVVQIYRESSNP
jgi:hypothetical protein